MISSINSRRLFIGILILLSLFVRIYRFNPETGFISGDDAYVALASLDVFNIEASPHSIETTALRFLSFGWGYVRLLVTALSIFIASIFHVPITEFVIIFPQIIIGILTCVLIYLLTKELFNHRVAILSSLIFSITPLAVSLSRTIYNAANTSTFFLILFIFLFIKYLKYEKYKYLAPISLGIYLSSDNQFISIFPVILFLIYWYEYDKHANSFFASENIKRFFSKINLKFISLVLITYLPALLPFLYFYFIKGKIDGGIIAHNFAKSKIIGFHSEIVLYLIYSVGIILFLLFIFSIFQTIFSKKEKNRLFLTIWFCSYILPWFFVISSGTNSRAYLLPGIIPLIILTADMLLRIRFKFIKYAIIAILFLSTLNHTVYTTYELNSFKPLAPIYYDKGVFGNDYFYGDYVKDNWGIKSAGYWIRRNTDNSTKIFTTIGTPVAKYYFGKNPVDDGISFYSINSGTNEQKKKFFDTVKDNLDLVVIREQDVSAFKDIEKSFNRTLQITQNKVIKLIIYSKKSNQTVQNISVDEYDNLFDSTYSNINDLKVECYFCLVNIPT